MRWNTFESFFMFSLIPIYRSESYCWTVDYYSCSLSRLTYSSKLNINSLLSFLYSWSPENLCWGWLPLWNGEFYKQGIYLSEKYPWHCKVYIFWNAWSTSSNFFNWNQLSKPCFLPLKPLFGRPKLSVCKPLI